ncbi:hypothetical protein QTP88_015833 [Uroleucon formosanum]
MKCDTDGKKLMTELHDLWKIIPLSCNADNTVYKVYSREWYNKYTWIDGYISEYLYLCFYVVVRSSCSSDIALYTMRMAAIELTCSEIGLYQRENAFLKNNDFSRIQRKKTTT